MDEIRDKMKGRRRYAPPGGGKPGGMPPGGGRPGGMGGGMRMPGGRQFQMPGGLKIWARLQLASNPN